MAREAVHLCEDLVESLLALVVSSKRPGARTSPADCVDLIDEDDRGRDLARLAEQFAHAARADADDHLNELAGARAEEGNVRLAGGSPSQQCFTGSRRPGKEHALRRAGAQPLVLSRILQEIDDLIDLGFDLVDTRNVVERDANGFRIDWFARAPLRRGHRPWLRAGA